MNRRNFLGTLASAAGWFSILPAAKLYERTWAGVLVPRFDVLMVRLSITDAVSGTALHKAQDYLWKPGQSMVSVHELHKMKGQVPSSEWVEVNLGPIASITGLEGKPLKPEVKEWLAKHPYFKQADGSVPLV